MMVLNVLGIFVLVMVASSPSLIAMMVMLVLTTTAIQNWLAVVGMKSKTVMIKTGVLMISAIL